jgi:hypothetical protein
MLRKIPWRGTEPKSCTIVSVISSVPLGSITILTSNRGVDSNPGAAAAGAPSWTAAAAPKIASRIRRLTAPNGTPGPAR